MVLPTRARRRRARRQEPQKISRRPYRRAGPGIVENGAISRLGARRVGPRVAAEAAPGAARGGAAREPRDFAAPRARERRGGLSREPDRVPGGRRGRDGRRRARLASSAEHPGRRGVFVRTRLGYGEVAYGSSAAGLSAAAAAVAVAVAAGSSFTFCNAAVKPL